MAASPRGHFRCLVHRGPLLLVERRPEPPAPPPTGHHTPVGSSDQRQKHAAIGPRQTPGTRDEMTRTEPPPTMAHAREIGTRNAYGRSSRVATPPPKDRPAPQRERGPPPRLSRRTRLGGGRPRRRGRRHEAGE